MHEERIEVQLKRLADKVLSHGNEKYRAEHGANLAKLVLELLAGSGGKSPNHELSDAEVEDFVANTDIGEPDDNKGSDTSDAGADNASGAAVPASDADPLPTVRLRGEVPHPSEIEDDVDDPK